MELLRNITFIFFVLLGLLLIIKSYLPLIKGLWLDRKNNNNLNNADSRINKNLKILRESDNSSEKAAAFVSLMSLSYVLVHTLINKGNNYNDEIQSRKFKKSLTPEMIKKLIDLEGKYE